MARKKMKVARYMFNLNEQEDATLGLLMVEDQKTEVSGYIGYLIVEAWKARQRETRKPGRPRKDQLEGECKTDTDEPRNIPHPDQMMNKGRMLTLSEYEAWNEVHNHGPK